MTEEARAPEEQLVSLFGSYRAEWLAERIYELFTEPAYFPELTAPPACVLEGGRGTGKTTVLRGLSYEGQFALKKRDRVALSQLEFVGCYLRVDTNVVTAFEGPELNEGRWTKVFAHYFNLLVCEQLCAYWTWFADTIDETTPIVADSLARVCVSLHIAKTSNVRELLLSIRETVVEFEAYINNVGDDERPRLSLQGAPIKLLAECLNAHPRFQHKRWFILLDEYENFLDYQQRVVNTLIKHGAPSLTYKVAIRELGWKCRTTLNPEEQLRSPADYVRIYIGEKLSGVVFNDFAREVCNDRVRRLTIEGLTPHASIDRLLPALSDEEEAVLLIGDARLADLRSSLASAAAAEHREWVKQRTGLDLLLIEFLASAQKTDPQDIIREAIDRPSAWENRRINYSHAVLFTVRRGKRGIRKYYSGWDTFIQLADGNIRFLLALVDQCLHLQLRENGGLARPISPEVQTRGAQLVGRSNLAELEGLSVFGAKLTRLLLGLGRVFGVLAAQAERHAPEQTQFELGDRGDGESDDTIDELLKAAVMHLALIRPEGTKPTDDGDTRDYDYMIHPIFAPYFVLSYRKKRKIQLSPSDLRRIVNEPARAIREILERHKRTPEDEPLPEQMSLFRQFYNGNH